MLRFGILLMLSLTVRALVIPATDSRIYHSEYNWHKDPSGFLETTNPGAYIRIAFTGTSIGITLDKPLLTVPFCTLAWSINGLPEQNVTLPTTSSFILLASGLEKEKTHSLFFYVKNAEFNDRWENSDQQVKLISVTIDDDATLFAPKLAPKRLLVYADSIGEGYYTISCQDFLSSNDAYSTWPFTLAQALNAELSLVAWSTQGYTIRGWGNVPPLWSSNRGSNDSAWIWITLKHPRTFETCPDYILNNLGGNDEYFSANPDLVTANAHGWLRDMRKTCPQSSIFLAVPFGRYMEDAITKAYKDYQADSYDARTSLIQLGEQGSAGLTDSGAAIESCDGLHP